MNNISPQLLAALGDLEAMQEEKLRRAAPNDFWAYRQYINKKLKVGWWQIEIARELQQFIEDLVDEKKPILIIQAPPQHGKSVQIIDFLTWIAGKYPDLKQIFSSFSDRLGVRANLRMRRIMNSDRYKNVFPNLRLPTAKDKEYNMNSTIIEFVNKEGSFRNTTVGGAITGESLDLGIIDDPIKGREAANSDTIREKVWEWFADDFFTRFSEEAGLLIIGTRWHIADPIGKLIDSAPENLKVLKYSAIATKDEKHRKAGEVLFPELKSLKFILARKKIQGISNFEALYQQSPVSEGECIFNEEDFGWYRTPKRYDKIVISWDTASKAKQINDPSVATVWGIHANGYDLLEVVAKRMKYPELKREALNLGEKWRSAVEFYARNVLLTILIEDKSSGQALIQDLKANSNFNIVAILPENDKIVRASTCSPQVEDGKVFLKTGAPWVQEYVEELTLFPNGEHDDRVDSTSQFLNWITSGTTGKITDLYF